MRSCHRLRAIRRRVLAVLVLSFVPVTLLSQTALCSLLYNVHELCQAGVISGAVEMQVGMDLRKAALLRSLLIKTEEKSNPTVLRSPSVDGMAVDDMSTSDLPNLQVMQASASLPMSGYPWARCLQLIVPALCSQHPLHIGADGG